MPARAHHARHFRIKPARIGHDTRGEHGNGNIEGPIFESHFFRVHFNQATHMGKLVFRHAFMGLGQHLTRQINANHLQIAPIQRQRQASTNTHFQNARPSEAIDGFHRAATPKGGNAAKYQIINPRPTAIGFAHAVSVQRFTRVAAFFGALGQTDICHWYGDSLSRQLRAR